MLFFLSTLFLACEPEVGCTLEYVYSSTIQLSDQNGEPISEASISYTVNGAEGEIVESYESGTFLIGGEEAGDFHVDIYVEIQTEEDSCCWDVGTAELEYTVEKDECHVIPVSPEVELVWDTICVDVDENGECE